MSNEKSVSRGWRNNYRKRMPLPEVISKDISFFLRDVWMYVRNGFKLSVVVVYPDFPSKKTTIHKIGRSLRYRVTNKLVRHPRAVLYFHDVTFGSSDELKKIYPHQKIFNAGCIDISKRKVDRIHQQVFGYATIINPTTYVGKAVQKSDINALHDGRILECPVDVIDEKSVYQVLIDNTAKEGMVMDYRVAVVGGKLLLAYTKYKKWEVRFTNQVSYSELIDFNDVFSQDEQTLILSFCHEMQVDFCELDILRNKTDQRIYIIDVNKTPYGPPYGLPESQRIIAIETLSGAFEKMIDGQN